ncbi:hypothetical protein [Halobacteriaceae bacterium SHR40]|uniref:hypothetical protein n=1 Tax=Halovenus amylolytica TaxID=2500550 RepID=UPI000FE30247
MVSELLNYISTQLPSIFTGLTMSIFGIGIYKMGDGWVFAFGKFRGKYTALALLLCSLTAVSLLTPFINSIWASILPDLAEFQIVGGLLVFGMIAVNEITGWNHFELKSGIAYAVGMLLIFRPDLPYILFQ